MEDEDYNLIQEMVLNNYQWSNERDRKGVRGKFNVDTLTLLVTKMDAMTRSLNHLNVNVVNSCASYPSCDNCGSSDHFTMNFHIGNPFALPLVAN